MVWKFLFLEIITVEKKFKHEHFIAYWKIKLTKVILIFLLIEKYLTKKNKHNECFMEEFLNIANRIYDFVLFLFVTFKSNNRWYGRKKYTLMDKRVDNKSQHATINKFRTIND